MSVINTNFIIRANGLKTKKEVTLTLKGERIFFKYGWSKVLNAEIKSMKGSKYHGYDEKNPQKVWSVSDCERNWFQIRRLQGENPYVEYDKPLINYEPRRDVLRKHQLEMLNHCMSRHYCIIAGEMGTGKTLVAIEVMEAALEAHPEAEAWYVGPKIGVTAVSRELLKWDCTIRPKMMTYEGLVKIIKEWKDGEKAPIAVIFDECSKIKNATAKRSIASNHVAEAVRSEWGSEGYVIEMSGTPSPKDPSDWHNLTEVACPGFLKEGTQALLKTNLSITEDGENTTGGYFKKILAWLDDENKCKHCGEEKDGPNHNMDPLTFKIRCQFEKSTNEVERLSRRLKGLVLVKFKKDCIDLPDKQYEIINITPTVETLRSAQMINNKVRSAVQKLTQLRCLSDGFQYFESDSGDRRNCEACYGTGEVTTFVPKEAVDTQAPQDVHMENYIETVVSCDCCGGSGELKIMVRDMTAVKCPKDDELIRLLDEHEENGRFIVWGGFTGTLDRLTTLCLRQGWDVLRVDGRGYKTFTVQEKEVTSDDFLNCMDASYKDYEALRNKHNKVVFVGHPQAGGMALTLTASQIAVFYSNCFSGEARMQAEDRFHRLGMDENKGCIIVDFIHLPTDQLVLDNLKQKKKLQDMSLGQIEEALEKGAIR